MHKVTAVQLVALLLCVASASVSGDVATYSFPVFNATTTADLVVATNKSVLTPAALLFESAIPGEFNSSEGFLLLSRPVDVWRAGDGGVPAREASFNTSFTVDGASPIAFVVLLDRFPTFNNPAGLRGANNSAAGAEANDTNGLAAVEVGTVKSYAPESPDVGLNVTITPNSTAASSRTVWIEYNAVAHRLWVYVAAGGQPRPPKALLDTPLNLPGRRTTQTAYVGFFAATVRDVILGVRDWDLTVDRFDGDVTGDTARGVESVAATTAIAFVMACYFLSRQ